MKKSERLPTLNPLDRSIVDRFRGRFATPSRGHWLRTVASLDPVVDAQTIHYITALIEFPFDYRRALELALYRTYCVPSISDLLEETGEFRDRSQKRYDDTALLMTELINTGIDRGRGRDALRVINRNHARYAISNDDYLYVLSTFIFEPLDWLDRYGYRRLHPHERIAAFEFYRRVGTRMGMKDIPSAAAELRTWRDRYEEREFGRTETTVAVGSYTLELMQSWFRAPAAPLVKLGVNALLDDEMRHSFGYATPDPLLEKAAETALRLRGRALRLFPARRTGIDIEGRRNRTYPTYDEDFPVDALGACPFHGASRRDDAEGGAHVAAKGRPSPSERTSAA